MSRRRKLDHIRTEADLRKYISDSIGKRTPHCVRMLEAFDQLTEGKEIDFRGHGPFKGLFEVRKMQKGYPYAGIPMLIFDEGKLCLSTGYVEIEEDGHIYLGQPRTFAGVYRKGGLEALERFKSGINQGTEIYKRVFHR